MRWDCETSLCNEPLQEPNVTTATEEGKEQGPDNEEGQDDTPITGRPWRFNSFGSVLVVF